MPVILRANRGAIQQKLASIKASPDSQQEQQLKILLVATGGDQPVARSLADYYKGHNNWREAAKTYLLAHPQLLIESANASAEAYDFTSVKSTSQKAVSAKQPDGGYWLAVAELNLGDTNSGCQNLAKFTGEKLTQLNSACKLIKQDKQSIDTAYELYKLGIPLQAKALLDKADPKTVTDWLMLAHINQRLGHTEIAINNLDSAIKVDAWNKAVLDAVQDVCQTNSNRDPRETQLCIPLLETAKRQQQLLLPR